VAVTPIVGGRVTGVPVQLGDHVRQGQALAHIFSPELAEAQTEYISARADLDAHERELARTEKLVQIGAASRQELDRIHAEHVAKNASVESLRSRLDLLGLSAAEIDRLASGSSVAAVTNVRAPRAGVVTERLANVGLNVEPGAKLFTIVDLSSVWVVADLYEKDFSRVRVGSSATITTTAYPALALTGTVSYIDPQVSPETRTAKLRLEVANPRSELRLGMYAEATVQTAEGVSMTLVPQRAIQTVGNRQVVYIVSANEPGKFTEREVRLGELSGENVEVIDGLAAGDVVVSDGSFSVRAERERLGLRQETGRGAARPADVDAPSARAQGTESVQIARVEVGDQGFTPARIALRAGVPARITFVRTSEQTCATEISFPALEITRTLPLNRPVDIEFTPGKEAVEFICSMRMLKGLVVAQ
jgi:RND family efflux transporter MFP subunit